ncbi:MAG TPA: hypothetical protein VMS65_07675, partial [Polyangiaceae bacterium]|nr:hypothetical protein [Polyangiaceae bacterium]
MVFASPIFLYLFLPVVLAGYALLSRIGRLASNLWLLLASVFFYLWGEGQYTVVMLSSMLGNYALGLLVDRARRRGSGQRLTLGVAIALNLALLLYFKYWNFVVANLNEVIVAAGGAPLDNAPIHLPIGISFFTFHALTYVVDVWRGEAPVQKNPVQLTLYLSLFPQLVAGPIVRYGDVARQLSDRRVTLDDFEYGCVRFAAGLAKKVLIANAVADYA